LGSQENSENWKRKARRIKDLNREPKGNFDELLAKFTYNSSPQQDIETLRLLNEILIKRQSHNGSAFPSFPKAPLQPCLSQ
jgi:hypothetical protein